MYIAQRRCPELLSKGHKQLKMILFGLNLIKNEKLKENWNAKSLHEILKIKYAFALNLKHKNILQKIHLLSL